MGDAKSHDLVVIGAGPGGYVAAIRAAQLGMDVACVEKEKALGGTCLRIGCIPSKAMLESSELYREARTEFGIHGVHIEKIDLDLAAMLKRKDDVVRANTSGVEFLFKKNKITRYLGTARFTAPGTLVVEGGAEPAELRAKHVIVATGSVSAPLKGVDLDGDRIGTSTEALAWSDVPKRVVVIGAGAIGLELGSVWSRLGAEVIVLEYLDRILPGMDAEIAGEAHKVFKKQGLQFRLGARVTSAKPKGKACVVEAEGLEPIECDRVLLAVGRKPNTEGLGLDAIGLALDEKGFIRTGPDLVEAELDRERWTSGRRPFLLETSLPGVFCAGDVRAGSVKRVASAVGEGSVCVQFLHRVLAS